MTNQIAAKKESSFNLHNVAFVLLSAFLLLKINRGFSGVDATQAGGIWNIIQIFFLLWGIFFVAFDSKHALMNRTIVALFFYAIFALIFAIPYLTVGMTTTQYFNTFMIPFPAMLMIVFYMVGMRYGVRKNRVLIFAYYIAAVMLIYAMMSFYNNGANLEDKGAVADVYYILGLLPLILVYTPNKWKFLPILVASVSIVFSGKRAGMLALIFMLTLYFFVEISKTGLTPLKRIGLFVLIVAAVVLLYFLLQYLDQAYNMNLFERMAELGDDGGSGRNRIWARTIASIKEFNFIEILTGCGKGSVRTAIGIEAHNDFLHVFHEHGLFATLCYVLFYISAFFEARAMFRDKYPHVHLFLISLICSLFIATFSFFIIYPTYNVGCMTCIGFFMGDYYTFRTKNGLIRGGNRGHYDRR